ncbi:MAG: hypothetical protein QJR07_13190 [Acetobacteraceae bacterium]|nr:hypothetical protein [Acetobacteraceae bacterium]
MMKGPRPLASALPLAALLPTAPVGAREQRICADPNNMPFTNAAKEGFENRTVGILAKDLHATVTYTWWAQRRGFLRNALKAGLCDIVPGTPANMEMPRTTEPYYRSTVVQRPHATGLWCAAARYLDPPGGGRPVARLAQVPPLHRLRVLAVPAMRHGPEPAGNRE